MGRLKNNNEKEMRMIDEEFTKGLVLIDFYAQGCGPCKMMVPTLEQLGKENLDVSIVALDVALYADLAKEYQIRTVPTFVMLKDGNVVGKRVGACSKQTLQEFINNNKDN